ncbi:MAG: hypothetical protein ACKOC6_05970, partial [bacterium]
MTGNPLAARAEAAILRLRDVDGVSVRAEGDELTEIHVVSRSKRSPKQIVRDIQAVLRTDLKLGIDHRIVSVALAKPEDARDSAAFGGTELVLGHPALGEAESRPSSLAPEAFASEPAPAREDRILFESGNLIVQGPRT